MKGGHRVRPRSNWGLPSEPGRRRLRIAALVLLSIPAAASLLLAIGELASGDVTGLQHIPEAAVLIALMWLAMRYPRGVAIALATLGVLFVAFFVVLVLGRPEPEGIQWVAVPVAALIVFGLPLAA